MAQLGRSQPFPPIIFRPPPPPPAAPILEYRVPTTT